MRIRFVERQVEKEVTYTDGSTTKVAQIQKILQERSVHKINGKRQWVWNDVPMVKEDV